MKLTTLAISNIKHNMKKYAMYFFAMCFCVFTTYSFLFLMNSDSVLSKIKDDSSFQKMFIGFGIAILMFILFFLISSNNSFIRARKKEISTYALFGMQNSKIGLLLFLETFILGLVALIVGITLGVFFSKLLTMILLKMVMSAYSGGIAFAIEGNAVLITSLIYCGIFAIMGLSGLRVINKFQLVDLFKGDKVSEGKSKGSYVLLVISLILIFAGYYFAISPNSGVVVTLMIPIIIVVVLGTFLFYIGGFQKILHLTKRNKKSYYKKTKLISISMLSHRSRTMATMMATIAVLVAIGTTAMAFGYTLYQGAEQQTYEQNSFDMYFYTDDEAVIDDVHTIFSKHDVEITNEITFQRYVSQPNTENVPGNYGYFFDEDTYLMTYKESTYNSIADIANGSNKEVSINKGEVIVLYPNYHEDIVIDDAKLCYADKKLDATFVKTNNSFSFGGMLLTLVMHDEDFDALVKSGQIATQFENGNNYSPFTGINYTNALTSPDVATELAATLSGTTGSYRLAYNTYNELLSYYGLLCFIGFFMCTVFILMTASMLYFKQITIATEERKQYEMLRKIGMDKDEENKIVAKRLMPVFFFPLILGIIHSVFAMKGADTMLFSNLVVTQGSTFISVLKTSLVMYVAYALVYTLFYFITKAQYKQAIK